MRIQLALAARAGAHNREVRPGGAGAAAHPIGSWKQEQGGPPRSAGCRAPPAVREEGSAAGQAALTQEGVAGKEEEG